MEKKTPSACSFFPAGLLPCRIPLDLCMCYASPYPFHVDPTYILEYPSPVWDGRYDTAVRSKPIRIKSQTHRAEYQLFLHESNSKMPRRP